MNQNVSSFWKKVNKLGKPLMKRRHKSSISGVRRGINSTTNPAAIKRVARER